MSQFYVYILYAPSKDIYYVGYTHDVEQRIEQHKNHFYLSNATKKADDWQLFWKGACDSKSQALKIEKHIKKVIFDITLTNLSPQMPTFAHRKN